MDEKETENKNIYPPKVNFSAKEEYGIDILPYETNSTYREDYRGTFKKRPNLIIQEADYSDIIAGPYIDPLLTDSLMQKQTDPSKWPSPNTLYKHFTEKNPNLKKIALKDEVDQSQITYEYDNLGRTVYQMEFCKKEHGSGRESRQIRRSKIEKLPDGWKIPRTVQGTSYRDFAAMHQHKLISCERRPKPFLPRPPQLGFTKEEQEVLQATTGETEYEGLIGKSAKDIIEHAFYGEVKPLPHELILKKN